MSEIDVNDHSTKWCEFGWRLPTMEEMEHGLPVGTQFWRPSGKWVARELEGSPAGLFRAVDEYRVPITADQIQSNNVQLGSGSSVAMNAVAFGDVMPPAVDAAKLLEAVAEIRATEPDGAFAVGIDLADPTIVTVAPTHLCGCGHHLVAFGSDPHVAHREWLQDKGVEYRTDEAWASAEMDRLVKK